MNARGLLLLSAGALLTAGAGAVSTIPWTELTESDWLLGLAVKQSVVDGRTVHYPTPTRELAAALEAKAGEEMTAAVALRHLAEAKRELGDRAGAEKALEAWAGKSHPSGPAWAEAARWGAQYGSWAFAFRSAEAALDPSAGLAVEDRRALSTERIAWAAAHPESGDALALRGARAAMFPEDAGYVEEWVRALEDANRLPEAEAALKKATALPEERRTLVAADLRADHGDKAGAYALLEAYVSDGGRKLSYDMESAFAKRVEESASRKLDEWRGSLEQRYDARALVFLSRYFRGHGRGDQAFELLTQVERRFAGDGGTTSRFPPAPSGDSFDRKAWVLEARLWESIDAIPEAFRARLAASQGAADTDKVEDLGALIPLALRAGGRALPWGVYDDEAYRWAARVDVTPGFFTGGLSFLLTGFDGKAALDELASRRLPDRTFSTARLLLAELKKRAPKDPRMPELVLGLMERHVERGEGAEALKLLPETDGGTAEVRSRARKAALQAARQAKVPLSREVELWKERLSLLAPDGSTPRVGGASREELGSPEEMGEGEGETPKSRVRSLKTPQGERYGAVLAEAAARLDQRDPSHKTSLSLLLGELSRLPKAETLWIYAAARIEGYRLDDVLAARYKEALDSFGGAAWWNRLARWYVRHKKQEELKAHVEEVVRRFRGAELFARDPRVSAGVPVSGQPNPYIEVSHYLRLLALERFPASPQVVHEAEAALIRRSEWDAKEPAKKVKLPRQGVVDDALLALRRNAVLFADDERRAALISDLMKDRALEPLLLKLEKSGLLRTPVEDRFLLDGWARLSLFEKATPYADALHDSYPGSEPIATAAISLHRSLSGLDPSHAAAVDRIARDVAPALADPRAVLTAQGETWQELDRPGPAGEAWRRIVEVFPRDPAAILEVSTIFWDYGRMREALDVLEAGRQRLSRPRMHAFEAGVLREEVRDMPGALDEYTAALRGEEDWEHASWSGGEYRAQNRLARLMAKKRVLTAIVGRIDELKPGDPKDEEALVPLLGLLGVVVEDVCQCDDWLDLPHDPVGREARWESRAGARPSERQGIELVGEKLLAKTSEMIPKATRLAFLEAVRNHRYGLLDRRWAADAGRDVELDAAILRREASLQPTEEQRIGKEVALADFLLTAGRVEDAARVWEALRPRIATLPEGGTKIRDLVAGARFAEKAGKDAPAVWRAVGRQYPWSLGVIEDEADFLFRSGLSKDGLDLLDRSAQTAAPGHKEKLTERLAREALDRGDLAVAKKALATLLGLSLDDDRRITVAALLARISLREEGGRFDALGLAKAEAAKLPEERRADLYASVASGARAEGKLDLALDLLIEALNRRLERVWITDASRVAARAGKEASLLKFFDAQRKRSPRDVRWAVAVREIKTFQGDLEGAIAASKEAVLVAPERESLHRETAELIVRAGRPAEAAEFLSAWARPRAGDESVAGWRAGLFLRAGEEARALAVEREAIAAWQKESAAQGQAPEPEAVHERKARAVRRFVGLNRPGLAWEMAGGSLPSLKGVSLSPREVAEIALRSGHALALLPFLEKEESYRSDAASAVQRLAKPEQKDELQAALLARLFPAGKPKSEAALNSWWDFAQQAGLHRFPEVVARRLLTEPARVAPWGTNPPIAFLRNVQPVVSTDAGGRTRWTFSRADFAPEWASYLVIRERYLLLEKLLAPLVADLNARVTGTAPLAPATFTSWFPVDAFAKIAALPGRESWRQMAAAWLKTPEAYRRLGRVTEGRWTTEQRLRPLVDLLDEPTRAAFLAHSAPRETPKTAAPVDAVMVARAAAVGRTTTALAALLQGKPNAGSDPDIVRLRGPRTVGEVMGNDPRYLWADFQPRPVDVGDDAVAGRGADAGRLPGRLWGARPGEAWYVLEAVARFREKDAASPWVPLESPSRGDESVKTLLAVRTAEGLGDVPLALRLDEQYFADLGRRDRLVRRLRLLVKSGDKARAEELLKAEVRSRQAKAAADLYLAWQAAAGELALTPPLDLLDAGKPVSAALAAHLYDAAGPQVAARFKPADDADFRAALSRLWYAAGANLGKDRTVFYLDELWARGDGVPYPEAGARKLGPWWPLAKDYLVGLPALSRKEGLAAVRALPDPGPLRRLAETNRDTRADTALLLAKAELASGEDAAALARLIRQLEGGAEESLRWSEPVRPAPQAPSGEEGEGEAEASAPRAAEPSSEIARLAQWARAFHQYGKVKATQDTADQLLGQRVAHDLDMGPGSVATWSLALELARTPEALARTLENLEKSWARGEWYGEADILPIARQLASRDKAAAARWLARLPEATSLAGAEQRAALLVTLQQPAEARRELERARARLPLTAAEEQRAFDAWRRVEAPEAPDAPPLWKSAAAIWKKRGPDLDQWGDLLIQQLNRHPYDVLSARVVLRSLAPAREAVVLPAVAALQSYDEVPFLRVVRSERQRSPRAARALLPGRAPEARSLAQRHYPGSEIDGLLSDLARVGAATSDSALLESALSQLTERKYAGLKALQAELGVARIQAAPKPETVRSVDGQLVAVRPRDLTWDTYARVLNAEDVP